MSSSSRRPTRPLPRRLARLCLLSRTPGPDVATSEFEGRHVHESDDATKLGRHSPSLSSITSFSSPRDVADKARRDMSRRDLTALALRCKDVAERLKPVTAELSDIFQETLDLLESAQARYPTERPRQVELEELTSLVPMLGDVETSLLELSKASKTCSRFISDQRLNLAMQDGLRKIPDEILLRIFELGYFAPSPHSSPTRHAIRLSHVSRRFRAVTFKLPVLWSTISEKMAQTQVNAFVQRSKQGPLSVSYKEGRTQTDLSGVIVRQAHRIVSLTSFSGEKGYKLLERLNKDATEEINFSILETLHLWNTDTGRDTTKASLIAPRLECLKLRNIVPSISAPAIRRITFEVHSRNTNYLWSAAPLLTLLCSLPNLDILDLSVGQAREPIDAHFDAVVVSAKKLRLIVNSESVSHITYFLAALDLPHLANLTVHIPGCYTTAFLRSLVPERCPELRKVKVCMSSRNAPSRASATQTVLSNFPQIHHLVLSNARFTESTRATLSGLSFPSLKSVVLSYCFVEESELLPFAEKLVAHNLSGQENTSFKELTLVSNCRARRYSHHGIKPSDVEEMGSLRHTLGRRLKVMTEETWSRDARNSWLA